MSSSSKEKKTKKLCKPGDVLALLRPKRKQTLSKQIGNQNLKVSLKNKNVGLDSYDVYVGRFSVHPKVKRALSFKFGNPHKVLYDKRKKEIPGSREEAVKKHFDEIAYDEEKVREIQRELKGKVLACWCEEGELCHADTLVEIANDETGKYPLVAKPVS